MAAQPNQAPQPQQILQQALHRVTPVMLLITMGIVYGDLGTSPLYTVKGIIAGKPISEALVLGSVSCIFWTLTLLTTIKYILITLQVDNKGEGGIFALYAMARRHGAWLLYPAVIGGGFLLADGIITPPISVSSAIEGLRDFGIHVNTMPIVIGILIGLFFFQQFGTAFIGRFFGPVMLVWFTMIAVAGLAAIAQQPLVLKALNPAYALNMVLFYPDGFWLLGSVFLCATGAEALYSDMGHVGRGNIRISWIFIKFCLLLSYFGQAAWLLGNQGKAIGEINPFYAIIPHWFLPYSILIATAAAIVASQALISGAFTLINEAMRLGLWPTLKIKYPSDVRGQLYVPAINWMLMIGCLGAVLYFKESKYMEAAFGLAVTLTMITTTMLLTLYLYFQPGRRIIVFTLLPFILVIEGSFLVANLIKIEHGGWVSLVVGSGLIAIMLAWYHGRRIKNHYMKMLPTDRFIPLLKQLSADLSVPKFATHLVYLTHAVGPDKIERGVIHSILNRQPKRADIYWFLNVEVLDVPYHTSYIVYKLAEDDVIYIQFRLGFRVEPRINVFFRMAVETLVRNGEANITSRYESLGRNGIVGDFHFMILQSFLSKENELPAGEKYLMELYYQLRRLSISEQNAYGLDVSTVSVEKEPLIISPVKAINLVRDYPAQEPLVEPVLATPQPEE